MSDLRIALVAEGPTDAIVIEAALKAVLGQPFVLTLLQPEPTQPRLGTGWGGVLRWAMDFAERGYPRLEADPTLPGFDLFVLHADADVADCTYADLGPSVATLAAENAWPALPNSFPCPPAGDSAFFVRDCLLSWARLQAPGPKTILCVPSKAVDAWLAAAVFVEDHPLLEDLECNPKLAGQLAALPMSQRIRKTARTYRASESKVTARWETVRQRCTQAERFSTDIAAVATSAIAPMTKAN